MHHKCEFFPCAFSPLRILIYCVWGGSSVVGLAVELAAELAVELVVGPVVEPVAEA